MQKSKVYISSTFKDLKDLRQVIIDYLNKQVSSSFDLTQVMELMYDKGDSVPFKETCINEVKNSDLYILIMANKVGTMPPHETKTYTEIEYETAMEKQQEDAGSISIFRLVNPNPNEAECDNIQKYIELKNKMQGLPTHQFTDINTFSDKFKDCIITFISENRSEKRKQRRFLFTVLSVIVSIIGVVSASMAYTYFKEFNWQVAVLVLCMFGCIVAYTVSLVKYPNS